MGANIRVDHSLTGDVTNTRGEFTISNLPEGTHTLNVSHLNYTTEVIGEREVVHLQVRSSVEVVVRDELLIA
ncbi:MAG: carboxypeptidase-like regulatory domain-containing protein, partial [Aggregatibacter sp.]